MRLEREKIKTQIEEGASIFRKAWNTGTKGRTRMGTKGKRVFSDGETARFYGT